LHKSADVTLALPLRCALGMLRNGGQAPGENVSYAKAQCAPSGALLQENYYLRVPKSEHVLSLWRQLPKIILGEMP